jgi:hypothetical protein
MRFNTKDPDLDDVLGILHRLCGYQSHCKLRAPESASSSLCVVSSKQRKTMTSYVDAFFVHLEEVEGVCDQGCP